MRTDHAPAFQRLLRRILAGLTIAVLLLAIERSVYSARADLLARHATLDGTIEAVRLAPGNARYLAQLATLKEPEDSNAEDALARARKLNPYDSAVWIQSGLRAELRGDRVHAEEFLLHAEMMSRQCEPQTVLANFYFRAGDELHFWLRVKRALACATEDRKPLFDLCWHMTDNAAVILHEAIAGNSAAGRNFLEYLLRHSYLDAAETAGVPVAASAGPADRELLLRFVERMADDARWQSALLGWNELCQRGILPYAPLDSERGPWITNGTFAIRPLNAGFDWNAPEVQGVSTSWTPSRSGLRIDFSGQQAEECQVFRQLVPVRPLRSYTLHVTYKLSGIPSGTGLRLVLTDASEGREIAAVALDGVSAPVSFTVSENASVLRLALAYRRTLGTTRIAGSILLNEVRLEAHP